MGVVLHDYWDDEFREHRALRVLPTLGVKKKSPLFKFVTEPCNFEYSTIVYAEHNPVTERPNP